MSHKEQAIERELTRQRAQPQQMVNIRDQPVKKQPTSNYGTRLASLAAKGVAPLSQTQVKL